MKLRPYTVEDVFTVADILATIGGDIKNIFTLTGGGNNTDAENSERGVEIVVYALNTMYAKSKDRLIDWFASLNGVSRQEFLSSPPTVVIDTIAEIATGQESKDFFSRVSALSSRIGSSGSTMKSD
jgi:hypothetical protein